jgi:hypothetical protein
MISCILNEITESMNLRLLVLIENTFKILDITGVYDTSGSGFVAYGIETSSAGKFGLIAGN